ncbi:unnamed protein product, partial [Phaeothamnion confervicola]
TFTGSVLGPVQNGRKSCDSRLHKLQESNHNQQIKGMGKAKWHWRDKKKADAKGKAKRAPPAPAKTNRYSADQTILVCGDGDFTFSRGLAAQRRTCRGLVATSLDSRDVVLQKYAGASAALDALAADGATVLHGVDARRLHNTFPSLPSENIYSSDGDGGGRNGGGSNGGGGSSSNKGSGGDGSAGCGGNGAGGTASLFDRVVFNFPHSGSQRVHENRALVRDFLGSAARIVRCAASGGEIHVTLKDHPPYSRWDIGELAREAGVVRLRTLPFDPAAFRGYRHRTTDPDAKRFDVGHARVHVFARARTAADDLIEGGGGGGSGGGGSVRATAAVAATAARAAAGAAAASASELAAVGKTAGGKAAASEAGPAPATARPVEAVTAATVVKVVAIPKLTKAAKAAAAPAAAAAGSTTSDEEEANDEGLDLKKLMGEVLGLLHGSGDGGGGGGRRPGKVGWRGSIR